MNPNDIKGPISERLAGKVAIVTGAGSGIGRGCALMMARHGAEVMAVDINETSLAETADMAKSEGIELTTSIRDMLDPAAVEDLMAATAELSGGIDILVNAGAIGMFEWIEDMDYEAHWKRTLAGELDIVFLACKAVWPYMKTRGGGAIINLASANSYVALKNSPALAHCAGKGGVLAMTRQLAMEGAPHRIRANSISPGMIVTSATRPVLERPELKAAVEEKLMVDRLGAPEDIAWGAVYLASDEAGYVTGTDLTIDGGALAW